MNATLRNILAVIAGLFIGGSINSLIVQVSASGVLFPFPEGVDLKTAEGWKAALPLLKPQHFILPFLAHALGTLAGALIAAMFGASRQLLLAMIVGVLFLIGGIAACFLIPAPIWFMISDLALAYIPMAWIGHRLGTKKVV